MAKRKRRKKKQEAAAKEPNWWTVARKRIVASREYIAWQLRSGATATLRQHVLNELEFVAQQSVHLAQYRIGKYVDNLGERVTTPCVTVADTLQRQVIRRHLAELYNGPRPPGAYICHRCDNRQCVAGSHLFWGTAQDNMRDCVLKGRKGKRLPIQEELDAARDALRQVLESLGDEGESVPVVDG